MNKFKVGVSDWELTLDDKTKIFLKTIIRESVDIHADGTTKIELKNANFDKEFVDRFKEGALVSNVHQNFDLRNSVGQSVELADYDYKDMKISKIRISSTTSTVGTIDITLVSK